MVFMTKTKGKTTLICYYRCTEYSAHSLYNLYNVQNLSGTQDVTCFTLQGSQSYRNFEGLDSFE